MDIYYSDEQLIKVHEIELEILSEIIRICDKNNINYFIDWGSLLGAVRHSGFIPWDDDIDIGMLRSDYERFCNVALVELKDGYSFQHFSVDENDPYYWAKIRKDGTVFAEKSIVDLPIHKGVFIDIFPYDKIPENKLKCKVHLFKVKLYSQFFISKSINDICMERNKIKYCLFLVIRSIIRFILKPVSKKFLYSLLDGEIRKYNSSDSETYCNFEFYRTRRSYEDVFPLKNMKFENIDVCVPNKTDKILHLVYGDYMKLPDEKNRVGHRPYMLEV